MATYKPTLHYTEMQAFLCFLVDDRIQRELERIHLIDRLHDGVFKNALALTWPQIFFGNHSRG